MAGDVVDAALLNKLKNYPKVMDLQFVSGSGTGAQHAAAGKIPIVARGGEIFGTLVSSQLILPPGRYYFDVPIKVYQQNTNYGSIYNITTSTTMKSAYSHSYALDNTMDNAVVKLAVTFTVTTTVEFRSSQGKVYTHGGTVTLLEEF